MGESLQNIRDIIIRPRAAFTRIKDDRKWFFTLVLCCIGYGIITWTIAPFEAHLATYRTTEAGENVNETVIAAFITEIIKAFVLIPILIVIFSMIYLAIARFFRINKTIIKFRHIYAILVHLMLIGIFVSGINTILLLIFKNPQDIHTTLDLQMLPGLHHLGDFLKNEKLLLFLSDFNLLSLWEVALSVIAIEVLTEANRTRAILAGTFISLASTVLVAVL